MTDGSSTRMKNRNRLIKLGGMSLAVLIQLGLLSISWERPIGSQAIAQAQTSQTAEEVMQQGLQSIQQRKLDAAIAAFQQAFQLNPTLAAAHYNLGLAL